MPISFDTLALVAVALIGVRYLYCAAKHDLGRADRRRMARNRRLAIG